MSRYIRRRSGKAAAGGGEDSFLDIVSNMVGILIILVMIAGTRVGGVLPERGEASVPPPAPKLPESVKKDSPLPKTPEKLPSAAKKETKLFEPERQIAENVDSREWNRYIKAAEAFEKRRADAAALKNQVDLQNEQMLAVRREVSGAQGEYNGLFGDISRLEAVIERSMREKSDEEAETIRLHAELERLAEEQARLLRERDALAEVRPKATLLENIPTPLTKKVEGKEAVFALRGGRISHVPIGECSERVRGAFRSLRDFKNEQIDETIGPIDGYRFHFLGSLHKIHSDEGLQMMVMFDFGEFLPETESLGEPLADALRPDSAFQHRLALYLKESSTITLAVWPDSFGELRTLKMNLLQNGYTIALRPMPAGANVTISPNGTESTIY